MAVLFGLFQALMPLVGWFGTNHFSEYLESIDHWIAFGILSFLGGKMIKDSFTPETEHHFNPNRFSTQLMLAVATSIDALAVGISFTCLGYNCITQMAFPLIIIGMVSFVMAVAGNFLGFKFGISIVKKIRPELMGGVILLFIGFKILLTHLHV